MHTVANSCGRRRGVERTQVHPRPPKKNKNPSQRIWGKYPKEATAVNFCFKYCFLYTPASPPPATKAPWPPKLLLPIPNAGFGAGFVNANPTFKPKLLLHPPTKAQPPCRIAVSTSSLWHQARKKRHKLSESKKETSKYIKQAFSALVRFCFPSCTTRPLQVPSEFYQESLTVFGPREASMAACFRPRP